MKTPELVAVGCAVLAAAVPAVHVAGDVCPIIENGAACPVPEPEPRDHHSENDAEAITLPAFAGLAPGGSDMPPMPARQWFDPNPRGREWDFPNLGSYAHRDCAALITTLS